MKRLVLPLALALVVFVSDAQSSRGGPTPPFAFATGSAVMNEPVEQESPNFFNNNCGSNVGMNCDPSLWVYNPTSCDWDVDDYQDFTGSGGVLSGSASVSFCVVSDSFTNFGGDPHAIEVLVSASSDQLTVTLTSDHGLNVSAAPVQSQTPHSHAFDYLICAFAAISGPYPAIPDSNGGTGTIGVYTVTVTNQGRAVKPNALIQTGFSGIYASSC